MGAYDRAGDAGRAAIVLNFTGLDYMNSGGIGLLVTLLVRAQRQRQRCWPSGSPTTTGRSSSSPGSTRRSASTTPRTTRWPRPAIRKAACRNRSAYPHPGLPRPRSRLLYLRSRNDLRRWMGTMDGVMPIAERKDARARSIGLRFLAVFVALASLSAGANASSPALAATTTLNSCDEPAFRRAVLGGGTVQFGLDCPALAFPADHDPVDA